MRFYRLEKTNYFKLWTQEVIKSVLIAFCAVVVLMLCMGYKFMIVTSGSMEPTLPVGSLILVKPCEYEDLELGDIVTLTGSGYNFTHRIVGKKDYDGNIIEPDQPGYDSAIWYTRGDNNAHNTNGDAIITTKEIVGKTEDAHCFVWTGELVRYVKANYKMLIIMAVLLFGFVEVLHYLKGKLEIDDIECYETDDE